MIVCGIDPGVSGALAFVDESRLLEVVDIPTTEIKKTSGITTRKINGQGLADSIKTALARHDAAKHAVYFVVEDVHVMPRSKSGSAANTSLMHSKGMIEGVIGALGYTPDFISSMGWKRFYGLIKGEKKDAIEVAKRLYSHAPLTLQKHHNRAEAILIARYGLRKMY